MNTNPTLHGVTGQIVRRNMTETPGCSCSCQVLQDKQWEAAEQWMWSARQRSRPCPLMWLRAVSLAASSLLIYTTAAIHNPNKPQTTNYVRLTLSAYHGSKTEKENVDHKRPTSLECNSRQYDDGAPVLSVVASLWIYCTTVHKPREVCGDWAVYFMEEGRKSNACRIIYIPTLRGM